MSVSHPVPSDAIMIAAIKGGNSESMFEVLLDGQVMERIKAGQQAVIGVAPYRAYKVSIRPTEGSEIIDYDAKSHEIVFFPGNVVKREWSANRVFIALGTLVDSEGKPMPRVRIRGTRNYTVTEEDGTFQIEITGDESLFVEKKGKRCDITIGITEQPQFFAEVGALTCNLRDSVAE
jgi:outer membrane usher protein FimD/PapC